MANDVPHQKKTSKTCQHKHENTRCYEMQNIGSTRDNNRQTLHMRQKAQQQGTNTESKGKKVKHKMRINRGNTWANTMQAQGATVRQAKKNATNRANTDANQRRAHEANTGKHWQTKETTGEPQGNRNRGTGPPHRWTTVPLDHRTTGPPHRWTSAPLDHRIAQTTGPSDTGRSTRRTFHQRFVVLASWNEWRHLCLNFASCDLFCLSWCR